MQLLKKWKVYKECPGQNSSHFDINTLKPWQMVAILQTTFSNTFSWMNRCGIRLKFRWSLFLRVQLIIFQYWYRKWLGAYQATGHYLNLCWLVYWRFLCTRPQWVNLVGWQNITLSLHHFPKLHLHKYDKTYNNDPRMVPIITNLFIKCYTWVFWYNDITRSGLDSLLLSQISLFTNCILVILHIWTIILHDDLLNWVFLVESSIVPKQQHEALFVKYNHSIYMLAIHKHFLKWNKHKLHQLWLCLV